VIETDGKLMSGRDVAIAALLGAEEFGFATAPLVTLGCVMMRVCHQDTCPMGVATQNPELRKRFMGKPEYVENFMRFIARELREYMARLGVHTIAEMVGRTDLLKRKDSVTRRHANEISLDRILVDLSGFDREEQTFHPEKAYDFRLEETRDEKELLTSKAVQQAIKKGKPCSISIRVENIDRSFGTLLGAEVTRHNPEGLAEETIHVDCSGAGGQSFGAFVPKGVTLALTGDSNDYFGKGLSGGRLIVKAPKEAAYDPEENIIIGNVALYGATSGEAYIAGMAGERFCIRNSGVTAVVEGVGEHGCEYMTGGRAVILGPTGKNFAAGMSGGIAYVLDEENTLYKNLNKQLVLMEKVEQHNEKEELRRIIRKHVEYTGSQKGQRILDNFDAFIGKFKKIIPADYKEMLHLIAEGEEQGMSREQAEIEAFTKLVG
ncbi:MAG: glutamate synthase subunit alpha, partial [Eubacterium sp.]|nr:glutamate synthase subunit alpha [Eubacterium sp.]